MINRRHLPFGTHKLRIGAVWWLPEKGSTACKAGQELVNARNIGDWPVQKFHMPRAFTRTSMTNPLPKSIAELGFGYAVLDLHKGCLTGDNVGEPRH